mgnify:CR=1 FL=1
MEDFKAIQWGWEKQNPLGMRSKEHIAFLLSKYNEGKPESEHLTTMAQLNIKMAIIAISVVCVISIVIAWNMVNYSKQIKEYERDNQRRASSSEKKKSKPKRSPKVSKDQVSNKRKYRNAKKKAVESKVKKNGKK